MMEHWFAGTPGCDNALPPGSVHMSWILGFERAKKVYDSIFSTRMYKSRRAIAKIKEMVIRTTFGTRGRFCSLGRPATDLENDYVQYASVGKSYSVDELNGALGAFNFHIAVSGRVQHHCIVVDTVGVYAKDEYTFRDKDWIERRISQPLGFWNASNNKMGLTFGAYVSNASFQRYQRDNKKGADFDIYSDVAVVPLKDEFTIKY